MSTDAPHFRKRWGPIHDISLSFVADCPCGGDTVNPGARRAIGGYLHDAACLACRRGVSCFQAVGWGEVNRAACEGVKTMDWATIAVIAELGALESQ